LDIEVLEKMVEWKRKSEASMIEGEGNDGGSLQRWRRWKALHQQQKEHKCGGISGFFLPRMVF